MRSKNKLTSKKSYLDLVKSKDDGGGGGGGGEGAVGKETSISVSIPTFLILMCPANFGYHLQHF